MLDLREPHDRCPRVDDRCKLLEHQFDGSSFYRRQDRFGRLLEGCALIWTVVSRPHSSWFDAGKK
jgi:hypothetical protein